MTTEDLGGLATFIKRAEGLKNVDRTSWTSEGRRESTAEHSWRLSLLALSLGPSIPGLDMAKVLALATVHDLGECINGDISAVVQEGAPPKSTLERQDLIQLLAPAPSCVRERLLALWEDYDAAASPEARFIKALDKIETIMQHNQGVNPADFNYTFNLQYGRAYIDVHPLVRELRALVDSDTTERAQRA